MKFVEVKGLMPDGQTYRTVQVDSEGRLKDLPTVMTSDKKALVAAGDYAAEDVMSESASVGLPWMFKNIFEDSGGSCFIVKATFTCETTGISFRPTLYLYNARPTSVLNDNVANTAVSVGDKGIYIGKIDFPSTEDLGGMSDSLATPGSCQSLPFEISLQNTSDLFGILVTRDIIANEAAGMIVEIKLWVKRS